MDGSDVTVWYQMALAATALGNLLLARTALDEVYTLSLTYSVWPDFHIFVGRQEGATPTTGLLSISCVLCFSLLAMTSVIRFGGVALQ